MNNQHCFLCHCVICVRFFNNKLNLKYTTCRLWTKETNFDPATIVWLFNLKNASYSLVLDFNVFALGPICLEVMNGFFAAQNLEIPSWLCWTSKARFTFQIVTGDTKTKLNAVAHNNVLLFPFAPVFAIRSTRSTPLQTRTMTLFANTHSAQQGLN